MGAPVSVFYRDVYWRFPHLSRRLPFYKKPALAFYRLEAWQIARHVDHVFLPSMRMKDYIPFVRGRAGVSALPPGGKLQQMVRSIKADQPLHLFYVGGVGGEQYDIDPMLRAIEAMSGVRLTLCCREMDWLKVRARYGKLRNVDVVHHSGAQLEQHYREADVFIMWRRMGEYLRFAMPVKQGEAIGWGLPIVTNADCEMGDTVERDGLGWAVRTENELAALLKRLRDDRKLVAAKQAEIMEVREQHSWESRARTVLKTLQAYRTRSEMSAFGDLPAAISSAEYRL
jgi:glycosyltransferase involved in cell wall biosynthesis